MLPKGVGKLRSRLTLRQPAWTDPDSGSGATVPAYADVATVWAQVEGAGGRELVQAQQVQPDAQYRIVIRYRSDVKEDWAGVVNGQTLNFLSVTDPDQKREYLVLLAAEQRS